MTLTRLASLVSDCQLATSYLVAPTSLPSASPQQSCSLILAAAGFLTVSRTATLPHLVNLFLKQVSFVLDPWDASLSATY